ncbi:MAG TPA: hypothetical protein VF104_05710 [Burkholderiales bacterium]
MSPAVRLAVAALVLTLAGCAQLQALFPPAGEPAAKQEPSAPEPWIKPGQPPPPTELESLLAYYDYLRKLQGGELVKEQDAARKAFAASKSDLHRLRLALTQSLPGVSQRNDAAAQALLEPMLKEGETRDPGLRAFAALLNATLVERRRHEERLREDQKQMEDQQRKLDEQQKKLDELQKKLDALTAIEKSLMERGRKSAPGEKK